MQMRSQHKVKALFNKEDSHMKRFALLLGMSISVVCVIVSCEPPIPVSDWSLVGTWINASYEVPGGHFAKVVFQSDGSLAAYTLIADSVPYASGTFTGTSDWTETGIHWFKVQAVLNVTTYYQIDKLTNNGNTHEMVYSTTSYPASFDISSQYYTIRTRQ
jgi:hypothetical protein